MYKWNVRAARQAIKAKMRKLPRDETNALVEISYLISAAEEEGKTEVYLTKEENNILK